jgi:hypothetical protein
MVKVNPLIMPSISMNLYQEKTFNSLVKVAPVQRNLSAVLNTSLSVLATRPMNITTLWFDGLMLLCRDQVLPELEWQVKVMMVKVQWKKTF